MKGDKHHLMPRFEPPVGTCRTRLKAGRSVFAHGVVSLYVGTNNTKPEIALSCNTEIGAKENEINLCTFPLRRVYLIFGINILEH